VQADCARFGEEIDRMLPTVSFGARDGRGQDLPSTIVWVDGSQVATRLDDGRSYELDPGAHSIRFVHDGKEASLEVVLAQGEKGRFLAATFKDDVFPAKISATPPPPIVHEESRSVVPLFVSGTGLAAIAVGSILLGMGLQNIPSSCSLSTHECAVPPNDPAFGRATGAVTMANAGLGIAIGGGVALIGGLIWYVAQPKSHKTEALANLLRGRF
jgi:hypothetical protein